MVQLRTRTTTAGQDVEENTEISNRPLKKRNGVTAGIARQTDNEISGHTSRRNDEIHDVSLRSLHTFALVFSP